jgi:hypothetical protein
VGDIVHAAAVDGEDLGGDALAVAIEIGRGVGLPNIRRVAELKAAIARPGAATADLFAGADGFAEVCLEDKYIVVQHLQEAGHVTGMTGDGVNDAPARRQAEVGIRTRRPVDHRSRARRWLDAVAELTELQAQYAAWLDALPDNLQDSATADALRALCELDLTDLQAIDPPRGFGRD